MILAHVIDDFVLQPVCLSKLKQKEWWEKNAPDKMYEDDYIAALIVHAVSWSIMILLPIMFFTDVPDVIIALAFGINSMIHAHIDNLKCNEKEIDLKVDQIVHLIQISITWVICMAIWTS